MVELLLWINVPVSVCYVIGGGGLLQNTVHTEKHGLYCTDTDRDYLKRKVAPNMILARRRSYFLQMGTEVPPSRRGTPIPVKHSEPDAGLDITLFS